MKKIYILLALCLMAGCVSTGEIDRNYNNLGRLDQGVSARAAKTIAQKVIMKTAESDYYRISFPDIKVGKLADKYPGYWLWFSDIIGWSLCRRTLMRGPIEN